MNSRLYLEAGPQISFLLYSQLKYRSVSLDTTKYLRTLDFGVGLGLGYYFLPNLGVTIRYVAGIGNIDVGGPRNDVAQMGLTYKF